MTLKQRLDYEVPVWVTRKTAGGDVMHVDMPLGGFLVLALVSLLNFVLWSAIALAYALKVIF